MVKIITKQRVETDTHVEWDGKKICAKVGEIAYQCPLCCARMFMPGYQCRWTWKECMFLGQNCKLKDMAAHEEPNYFIPRVLNFKDFKVINLIDRLRSFPDDMVIDRCTLEVDHREIILH